ncbi:MAG: 3-dehydroquinate synthase, partial [Proteobacteria bacterium]|nr:3-dehydroquinate synthase [Pseudomonadota bacterium]
AIESATNFLIPHGIAVTIGMDLANFMSWKCGLGSENYFRENHPVMEKNFKSFRNTHIPIESFVRALQRDKKNLNNKLCLILPDHDGEIKKNYLPPDQAFASTCENYFRCFL